ncbi:7-carboxy-7-deazaguanine synthase QueE [Wolinella succinogenes]|uniref:7-carboxy-7-deazaguanine synthase QueE n=1 Tax=Wolinella succinogenes TaxID=844 RepID=UPI00240A0257|nr:radical SAM protein [Wolinella succinogenes]
MYPITEIFYSIQGEGHHSGKAALFVRLHGCNLACDFCDEPSHTQGEYENQSQEAILEQLRAYPAHFVVITGGEPTLFDLNPLIKFLQKEGYFVAIETNGYNLAHIQAADWITYSPKNWNDLAKEGYDELKFIIHHASDITPLLALPQEKPLYLQPQSDGSALNAANVARCVELILEHPEWRLSLQTHKILEIP